MDYNLLKHIFPNCNVIECDECALTDCPSRGKKGKGEKLVVVTLPDGRVEGRLIPKPEKPEDRDYHTQGGEYE